MIIDKKVSHKILIERLKDFSNVLSMEYNGMITRKMNYADFMSGRDKYKYDTYLTVVGDYITIKFCDAGTKDVAGTMIMTKKQSVEHLNFDIYG